MATITRARAKTLMAKLRKRRSYPSFPSSIKPSTMKLLPGEPRWGPRSVKKYEGGSFQTVINGDTEHPYICDYLWDLDHPGTVTLYLYGIQFDD